MSKDFKKLLKITKDEKFVTARHSLQCMWKIAIIPAFTETVIKGLKSRFDECISEKNGTLLRYDIIEVLRKIYDGTKDTKIKEIAYKWIGQEDDEKYKKKYTTLWKDVIKAEKM